MQHESKNITVTCRFCGAQNRFEADKALTDLTAVRCGSCQSGLLRVHGEPLTDVTNEDLAHKWDLEALARLKSIPLLDTIISKILGSTLDQTNRFNHLASSLRVSSRQLPHIHRLYLEAAGRLDVDPPPLFVVQHPSINAYTSGAKNPIVALTAGAIENLPERSILGILGHELTHVRLGHVLYRWVASLLAQVALGALSFLGLARIALRPIQMLFSHWMQMSELSADRGELIATGSLESHIMTHAMLAGGGTSTAKIINVGAFVDQAHEAESMRNEDLFVSLMELLGSKSRTHPLNVWRVHHALAWARGEDFFRILAGKHQVLLPNN